MLNVYENRMCQLVGALGLQAELIVDLQIRNAILRKGLLRCHAAAGERNLPEQVKNYKVQAIAVRELTEAGYTPPEPTI